MPTITIKLPPNPLTLHLPAFTTTAQSTPNASSYRVTRSPNQRATRAGNVRITRLFTATSYPEIVAIKLPDNRITVNLPDPTGWFGKHAQTGSKTR